MRVLNPDTLRCEAVCVCVCVCVVRMIVKMIIPSRCRLMLLITIYVTFNCASYGVDKSYMTV